MLIPSVVTQGDKSVQEDIVTWGGVEITPYF